MNTTKTKQVTLTLPVSVYEEMVAAQERQQIGSVAEFIRDAVVEKLTRMNWQHNLEALRREIRQAGGLRLGGNKEQIIERLRETRREIFEAEYAHLYR